MNPSSKNGYFAIFISLLVIAAAAAVVFVYPDRFSPKIAPPPISPSATQSFDLSGSRVLLADEAGAWLQVASGSRPLKWPEDVKLLGAALSTFRGHDVKTGEDAYLESGFILATSSVGFRSPDGRRSIHPTPSAPDGTSAILIRYGGDTSNVILREENGRGIRDAQAVGWWDNETVAVVGIKNSVRTAFAVGIAGGVRVVASLPETATRIEIHDGGLWYVTLTPGEGLESEPAPPSELHRLMVEGKDSTLMVSPVTVISRYVVVGGNLVATQNEKGKIYYSSSTEGVVAEGVLLDATADGKLLIRNGEKLSFGDPRAGGMTSWQVSLEKRVAVFILKSAVVDEKP
ncbi:MAG: hypothetical protein AAB386_03530 [Patescibacteria group bacterium]